MVNAMGALGLEFDSLASQIGRGVSTVCHPAMLLTIRAPPLVTCVGTLSRV